MSGASFVGLLRLALADCCGLTMEEARIFGGHAMRVGSSNRVRQLGVRDEVQRGIDQWMTLASVRSYFQLSTREQLRLMESMWL